MLKYFRKLSRHNSATLEYGQNNTDVVDEMEQSSKHNSLRSTSSFCDEVFLEELFKASDGTEVLDNVDDDAISCGALSLDAFNNAGLGGTAGVLNNAVALMTDKDVFKYHSRLCMTLCSIVSEPNCLSYFVQYLESKNALLLIKFYLDTENFKNSAIAQLKKETKGNFTTLQEPMERDISLPSTSECQAINNYADDERIQEKRVDCDCDSDVPELKTLCDLSMRKPITDDEKSQIFAETSRHLYRCSDNQKLKASSELSLCSSNFSSNVCLNEFLDSIQISDVSIKDALTIYQKYLIVDAAVDHIKLPVDIISKISLILCRKSNEMDTTDTLPITADCFVEAQHFILEKLEKEFLNDFLQSNYYFKYCVELIENQDLNICDILHSEVTLFYFMEYLEQQGERDCLDFWSTAINYRKSYVAFENPIRNEDEARADAMIIYERFFSLQAECGLWASSKLRAYVESTICSEAWINYCFDLPLKVAAKYLERKHLKNFLKSSLFDNYLKELKSRIENEKEIKKMPLRRSASDKTTNRFRKNRSDCILDRKPFISQRNTLLASMDNNHSSSHFKQFKLDIDSSQLTNPDLLWHRSHAGNGNGLKFGYVNSLGRYERDFVKPSDALIQNSLKSTHNKLKKAVRKLVNLPQDSVQEEIAWQVAEMIVKDITKVTMGGGGGDNKSLVKTESKANCL
ncbi:A-kinase anchor protein 10, mitochondrial [Glossina fuscipes]|uniref:A-kinase anchor protein 10, mitochondrial n=1 Tax=Glossina fuscipes TaxID=7396 RepID=A0A8U0WDK9_9MUSC|nr:A-kinase anchor protein 10, mitochondrial [Glossina fuscipes]KAI9585393.1 hypothetical protein GQX74_001240 [Glossina fuscipes]